MKKEPQTIEKKAVYYCEHCHNIVEALWNGRPGITCCNHTMKKLEPNTVDAAQEKHVPAIQRDGNRVTVKVGEVAHPMESDHYILFVEVLAANKVYRQDFVEGDAVAEAVFLIEEQDVTARAFCNKHGFWQA